MLNFTAIKHHLFRFSPVNQQQKQVNNIAFITFWSQFSVYVFNTILVLFLTRPVMVHGLGFSESKAYAFIGITQAVNYLLPMLGGYMADNVLRIRRSILVGSILLALAYLLIMLSGYFIQDYGDALFIAAYAFVPVMMAFAMGAWYLSNSLAYVFSGQLAKIVALPKEGMTQIQSLNIYQDYYFSLGVVAVGLGLVMLLVAKGLNTYLSKQQIAIH